MTDSISLYGHDWNEEEIQYIDINLLPCNQRSYGGELDYFTVSDKCNSDLNAQQDFIGGNIVFNVLYNQEKFDPTRFEKDKIVQESKIAYYHFNPS